MSTLVAMPKGKEITRKNNVTGLPSFSSWFDNFFDNSIGTEFLSYFNTGITLPAVNIKETANDFILELAIPGMKKSDFIIDVENKILSISSEVTKEEEEKNEIYTRREFGYSSFKRTLNCISYSNNQIIQSMYAGESN